MTTYQTQSFLSEVAAGHFGPSIPASKRAYFQQRFRLRIFNYILNKFVEAQSNGLTKAALSRRIGKTPDQVNRWLGSPSNLTADTMSDLLLGIAAEEFEIFSSSPLGRRQGNYSRYDDNEREERRNQATPKDDIQKALEVGSKYERQP
jgi:hypothetical protein